MSKFLNIRVDQIVPSRWQPREGVGNPEAFAELVASVKLHGVKSPLKAFVNEKGTYELIAGHRRHRAAIKAGLTQVLLMVVDTPKNEAGLQALREEVLFDNLLHEPLTPLEEARAFKALQGEGYSIRDMAEKLGKGKGYIEDRLRLLNVPDDVQELVSARADTLHHVREIAKVPDAEQRAALIEETKQGATSREIKAKVAQIVQPEREGGEVSLRKDTSTEEPEPAEPRLIPVNGNGETTYVSVPSQEEMVQQVVHKYTGVTCAAAGAHCPHCGDGRGKEVCGACGRERWVIAFGNFETYQKALTLIGHLIR